LKTNLTKNISLKFVLFLGFIFIVSIILSGAASAASVNNSTIYVSNQGNNSWNGLSANYNITSGNGPKATITNATGIVSNGGTVYIASGIYNENNIQITKNMTILGANQQNTIINGTNSGTIFTITPGVKATISKLTLTQGKISVYTSGMGGAITNYGTLTLTNSTLQNNTAIYVAGGIYNWGTLTIINCTLQKNTATKSIIDGGHGGAILNAGTLTIENSILNDNLANDNGGAIYNDGTLTITNSTLQNNTALSWGGGAISNYGKLTIMYSTLQKNTASYGGAIFNYDTTSIEFSQIIGNTASTGSAIDSDSGTVNAKYNWWGSNANPSGRVSGNVIITNWLTTPLNINNINPTDNTVNVPTNEVITITFNEPIKAGNMSIQLENRNGTVTPLTTNITGNILTIKPLILLTNDTKYTLILHTGSLTDPAGNPLTLITTNFSTGPTPTVTTINPPNGTLTNITITFNEPIQTGNMQIQLKNSNGSTVPFNTSINGNILTLTPKLSYHYIYYVNPTDTPSYDLNAMKKAGITDVFMLVSPTPGKSNYYATYLPQIKPLFTAAGITLHAWIFPDFTTQQVAKISAMGINIHLDLEFGYLPSTEYVTNFVANMRAACIGRIFTVAVDPDAPDVDSGAIYGENYNLLAQQVDAIVPMLYKGYFNLSDATMKSAAAYMQKEAPGKLWIALQSYQSDNNPIPLTASSVLTQINDVKANANGIASFRYGLSNFASAITNIITYTNKYTLTLQTGSITDLAGNPLTLTTTSFTMNNTPTIITTNPKPNATNVSLTTPVTINFNENITAGTKFTGIYIKNLTTGNIVSLSSEIIKDNTLTITTTYNHLSNDTYQVYIPAGAVKDLAGNNLTTAYTFKFKTL